MKVNINYTIEVTDAERRAINIYHGREGLATREQVKDWYKKMALNYIFDLATVEKEQEIGKSVTESIAPE